jgi:VanZ family protein
MDRAQTESRRRRSPRDLALIGALVLLAAVLFWLPTLHVLASHSRLRTAANNSAHLPLFGLMALVLLALSVTVFRARFSNRATHYWVAFCAATVLAGGTELVQFFGPRDADLNDVALDLLGAGVALGVVATFDRRLAGLRIQRPWFKRAIRFGAAVVLVSVFVPVLLWAEAYRQRNERFPTLCGFDTYWESKFLINNDSEFTLTDPPSRWNPPGGGKVGRWFGQGGAYPSLGLREPCPDWRGYESLRISLYSIEDDPVRISITICDERHIRKFSDRFTGSYVLEQGVNEIEIDLDDVRRSPKTREMDMATITEVTIYSRNPVRPFTVFVDDMRLVSRATAGHRPAAK